MSIKVIAQINIEDFEKLVNYYCACGWELPGDMHVNVIDKPQYDEVKEKYQYLKKAEYSIMLVNRTGIPDKELEYKYALEQLKCAFERNNIDYKPWSENCWVALMKKYMEGYCTVMANGQKYKFIHPLHSKKDYEEDVDYLVYYGF